MEPASDGGGARRARALRGSSAGAIAVLFAATGHTLAGGAAPPAWLVVAVTVLAAPLCTLLVGRRRRLSGLVAAAAAAQIALHTAFAAVGSAAPSESADHAHHHATMLLDAGVLDPATATMTLGHAVSAVVTMATLVLGARLVAAIARGIRRLFGRLRSPRMPRPVGTAAPALPRRGAVPVLLSDATRRGPPAHRAPTFAV